MARNRYPPIVRAAVREARRAGFDPVVIQGKRRFKIRWVGPGGRPCVAIVSVSPSCRFAEKKALADVRRTIRQAETPSMRRGQSQAMRRTINGAAQ